jgi:DNA-binding XRE family transcriptional regulator
MASDKEIEIRREDLPKLAREYREKAGDTKMQAAKRLGIPWATVHHAETEPDRPVLGARVRLIQEYSPYAVRAKLVLVPKAKAESVGEPLDSRSRPSGKKRVTRSKS